MPCVLIVDDEPDHCDVVARMLHRVGLQTLCAANGWEALIALDNNEVDLVLLDLMMPGMDGGTFLNILRNDQRRKHLPVMVVSAVRSDQAAAKMGRQEVQQYFEKANYDLRDLLKAVEAQVHASDSQDAKKSSHRSN